MKIVKPSFKLIVIVLVCFTGLSFIGTKVIGFINPAVADLDMNGYNILMRTGLIGHDGVANEGFSFDTAGNILVNSASTLDMGDNNLLMGTGLIGFDGTANEGFSFDTAGKILVNSASVLDMNGRNILMGAGLIGYDGTANEGWSFDTAGNITFGSAGSYLDMGGKNITLGAGWFGRAASAVTFDASENVVITQGLFLGANGIGNDNEVLTFAAGATGKGIFAGAVDVTGNTTVAGHRGNDAQQTITLGVGVTTFAVTRNVIQVTGDGGGNVIATITGASVGLYTFIFVDEFVTISNNDAHGANTVDLDGANDFGSADDTTLLLVFDGTSWYKVGTSAN